jgi:hypothetical protein
MDRQTDDGQRAFRKTHMSFPLRLAKNEEKNIIAVACFKLGTPIRYW